MRDILLLLTCLFLSQVDGNVHVLTEKNFKNLVLDSPDYWLVEFYAPWCGHCKKLEPEWKKAASKLKTTAKLGAVDCTVHQNLAQQFGIQGYPTIKEFGKNKNKPQEYRGGRTASEIIEYVKASPLAALGVSSNDALAQVLQYKTMSTFFAQAPPNTPSAILLGRKKQKKGSKPRWVDDVAQTFADKKNILVQFGVVPGNEPKVGKAFGIDESDLPALVYVSPEVGFTYLVLTDPKPAKQIKEFVQKALKNIDSFTWHSLPSFPPPQDNTPRTKPPISVSETTLSTFEDDCLDAKDGKLCVLYIPKDPANLDLKPVAKHFRRDKLTFYWVNPSSPLVPIIQKWVGMPIAPPEQNGHCIVFKISTSHSRIRIAEMANVIDNEILEIFLSHIVEGLEQFKPIGKRPLFKEDNTYNHNEL
ncbi:disulfide-isomerase [Thraustotheca clavata]|uniref:Disulfide-isomerase n=1 Tax=Thraustotheca clavata TaxID=74557 RepID=A0A1W0A5I6_9STRA|nr:disulfide-isomerase [Thraustotheca clavata]